MAENGYPETTQAAESPVGIGQKRWPVGESTPASHGNATPPPVPGWYIVCFECGAKFATADEVMEAHAALALAMGTPLAEPAKQYHFCPECLHDF